MIREPLLDKSAEYENNYNRNIMLIFVCSYTAMLIIITINISNMANNLDTIIDFMNTLQQLQMNNTNIDGINQDLHTIKDCVLNRYCKRT